MAQVGYPYQSCIYTILHTKKLERAYAKGGAGMFVEKKRWVTGKSLLVEAHAKSRPLVILFGQAEAIVGVAFAAIVTAIEITDLVWGSTGETLCRFEHLTPLTPPPPLNSLWVNNTRRTLSRKHIRSYVLCKTPEFVFELEWNQELRANQID